MRYPIPPAIYWQLLTIDQFAGINKSVTETQIEYNESSNMLNMTIDEKGALEKRPGYKKYAVININEPVTGMYTYRKNNAETFFLVATTNGFYYLNGTVPVQIFNTGSEHPAFFTINGLCYILTGNSFKVFDGSTMTDTTPYAPTLTIATPPAGGGTMYEQWNLLGSGFKTSFSADGTSTEFVLGLQGLDAALVSATVGGNTLVENTDFTVDRTLGKAIFNTPPVQATSGDNVVITAYKTVTGQIDKITKCTISNMFGGSNDTRVFISGNSDYPNMLWRSDIYNPTFWPENDYIRIGSNAENITGFSHHYDSLVIHKENSIWNITYELNAAGEATFPCKPVNDFIGCINPDSIQLLENNPAGLTPKGIYVLQGGVVRDERNVTHISEKIDRDLLKENFKNIASVDFDGKYFLTFSDSGNTYVFDYRSLTWYPWNHIPATCYQDRDGGLFFGAKDGCIYQFYEPTEENVYNDDGQPIQSYWESKLINFSRPWQKKAIEKIFCSIKPGIMTSASIYYSTDSHPMKFLTKKNVNLFRFNALNFANFSFLLSPFPKEIPGRLKTRNIYYVKIRIENNELNESLGITSIDIKYRFLKGEV